MTLNYHIQDEKLIGYLYRTLSDSDRENIDDHLVNCRICRSRFSFHKDHHKQIDQEIRVEIKKAAPPPGMTFAKISPRLQHKGIRFAVPEIASLVSVATTLLGLAFAVFGLWQMVSSLSLHASARHISTLPALASFSMILVTIDQFDRSYSIRPRFIFTVILAGLLWLSTAIIGFLDILVIRDIALILGVDAAWSKAETETTAIAAVIMATIAFITMVIGGAEYHYRNVGQPSSWKLFLWTIIIQLLVMIIPYFLW